MVRVERHIMFCLGWAWCNHIVYWTVCVVSKQGGESLACKATTGLWVENPRWGFEQGISKGNFKCP